MSQSQYGADNITVLEGLEAVRKRPGMYIGNTGQEGLHRCFGEILDNSVDEYMAGEAHSIKVKFTAQHGIYVADDGRGIPTDIHPKTGKTALETIMTVLHAGGKFDQSNYQFSGGLHGVGASVVNALSTEMNVWVLRDKKIHYMQFSKGKVSKELAVYEESEILNTYPEIADMLIWSTSGTIIHFIPDGDIFETTEFDTVVLKNGLKQTAYLNKGVRIIIDDSESVEDYHFPKGILTFLEDITKGENLITPTVQFEGGDKQFYVEVAMAYSEKHSEKLYPFTNGIFNAEGGAHVTGLRTAIAKLINNYAVSKNMFKKEEKFTSDDLKEGLRVILSVKMADPQFTSQSKVKLGSTIARTKVDKIVTESLGIFLEENPIIVSSILSKAALAMKARLAARAARESVMRKGALETTSLPGKLADCSSKKPEDCEIYIVEGDSAGGSAKQGRDRDTQAILPLRGKVLNTERATLDRIMNYEGIKNMIIAFGAGIGERYDATKLRYHKIILMTDADVDGAHITTLLLTFLYRYMPELIEGGYVYMARPPLYKIEWGKNAEYVYSDAEKDAIINKLKIEMGIVEEEEDLTDEQSEEAQEAQEAAAKKKKKINVQRYKGLGEMNPDQLWDTTMNPATRLLWQVTVGEAQIASQVFEDLMGADVAPRREFIEANAQFVSDLDLV